MKPGCERLLVSVSALVLTVPGGRTQTVLVEWHFPDHVADATADGGILANTNRTLSVAGVTNTMNFTLDGAASRCAHVSGWADGADTYHWLISFATTGYGDLALSSKQRSSPKGPRNFKAQYRVGDGDWSDVPAGTVACTTAWAPGGNLNAIPLPGACDDRSLVAVRWIMVDNESADNTTVTDAGVSRIDDIVIHGRRLHIPAPVVLNASRITSKQFVARWQGVDLADGYLLDVSMDIDFAPTPVNMDDAVIIDFEGDGETKGSYTSGTVSLGGAQWSLNNALIGSTSYDWKEGVRSARLRGYGDTEIVMLEDLTNGLGLIAFSYRRYGTDTQVDWRAEYSLDAGGSWTRIGRDFTAPATDAVQAFSNQVGLAGSVRVRIKRATESGTDDRRLNIDDIVLTPFVASDFLPGYEFRPVAETSHSVMDVNRGTYYYRVRATDGGVVSPYSETMRVRATDAGPHVRIR